MLVLVSDGARAPARDRDDLAMAVTRDRSRDAPFAGVVVALPYAREAHVRAGTPWSCSRR